MAKAVYLQKGEILDFTNTGEGTIEYSDVVALNNRVGIAREQIAPGNTGSVSVTGVYELPADTSVAFAAGEPLYWDVSAGKVVKTSGDIVAGWAFADKVTTGNFASIKIG